MTKLNKEIIVLKHSFSLYTKKYFKVYKRYFIKRLLDSIINTLIFILISFLLGTLFIIYLTCSDIDDTDLNTAESNISLINLNSCKDSTNVLKQELKNFTDLFKNKLNFNVKSINNISKFNYIMESNSTQLSDTSTENTIDKSNILREVKDLHFKTLIEENDALRVNIYLLKIQIQKEKLERLKLIEDITKELNTELADYRKINHKL